MPREKKKGAPWYWDAEMLRRIIWFLVVVLLSGAVWRVFEMVAPTLASALPG
jgi:hypothetical protein